jgi:hypothetical protein
MPLEFSGPLSRKRLCGAFHSISLKTFPFKLSKNGPKNSERIVRSIHHGSDPGGLLTSADTIGPRASLVASADEATSRTDEQSAGAHLLEEADEDEVEQLEAPARGEPGADLKREIRRAGPEFTSWPACKNRFD